MIERNEHYVDKSKYIITVLNDIILNLTGNRESSYRRPTDGGLAERPRLAIFINDLLLKGCCDIGKAKLIFDSNLSDKCTITGMGCNKRLYLGKYLRSFHE